MELKALCARLRFPVKHELILDVALTHPSFDKVRKPSPAKIRSTRFRQSNNSALLRSGEWNEVHCTSILIKESMGVTLVSSLFYTGCLPLPEHGTDLYLIVSTVTQLAA